MALYKIGVTEAGDAGVDLSWEEKLDDVDAAVLITKCVSPDFFDAALRHKDQLIIHTTVTGYGHSILEPNVPTLYEEFTAIMELVKAGFPMSRIVVRVDPIIPTEKGLSVAYHTLISFMEMGFQRYRVSVIDMYPHARNRFKEAGLSLPYPKMYTRWREILRRDFIQQNKWLVMNCTIDEYLEKAWPGGVVRSEPTDEVIREFAEYSGLQYDVACKYFNRYCANGCLNTRKEPKRIKSKEVLAMNMKMFGRNIDRFLCRKCLMKELGWDVERWNAQVNSFHRQGCQLF